MQIINLSRLDCYSKLSPLSPKHSSVPVPALLQGAHENRAFCGRISAQGGGGRGTEGRWM